MRFSSTTASVQNESHQNPLGTEPISDFRGSAPPQQNKKKRLASFRKESTSHTGQQTLINEAGASMQGMDIDKEIQASLLHDLPSPQLSANRKIEASSDSASKEVPRPPIPQIATRQIPDNPFPEEEEEFEEWLATILEEPSFLAMVSSNFLLIA
jgi:hypothetical protein